MKVSDPLDVVAYGLANVALHDLAMAYVQKHFHSRRVNAFADLDGPFGTVALLIRIVDAVDRLETDCYRFVLGLSLHTVQKSHGVVDSNGIRQPAPISGDG